MNIVFRVDASIQMGTGHVMRCLTLAEELRRLGHSCVFICREHPGNLGEFITNKGFVVHSLSTTSGVSFTAENDDTAHAEWLGASWRIDAEQTLVALGFMEADWLVVDHYALDARWERLLAKAVDQTMVIDDLADREHECAVLLDQNVLCSESNQLYKALVNTDCTLLLGPRYALLRPEYAELAKALPERDGNISRVLVFVGGSDPHNLTERYLNALSAPGFQDIQVDVVIGKNHPAPKAISALVSQRGAVRLYSGLPTLAALMVRADLMLGAGGATNWERMCLGLTSIVVSVAHNQDEINRELADQAFIHFLGKAEAAAISDIQTALLSILSDAIKNSVQSKAMRTVVDGCGTARVAQLMQEARKHAIT